MKRKLVQSITAYRCRICKKYENEDLLKKSEKNKEPISLELVLNDFFEYISSYKIDDTTSRTILLSHNAHSMIIKGTLRRIHIEPDAGKALENFSVVNHKTNEISRYKGDDNSAVYPHNVLFYIDGEQNVFVFHHYGQSGCKTAFLNTFNEFLSEQGLIAHLDVLMSSDMFKRSDRYEPEKLSLITTYSNFSTDKADNISNKSKKKIEQETIISLSAPRAKNVRAAICNVVNKAPTVDELREVLIRDNFPVDFEDARITIKFGQVRRSISLSQFSGLIAEYDITDKLEILADGSVQYDSLYEIADEYAMNFFE